MIEKGIRTKDFGNFCYQNANYGLFRILIPSILGYKFSDPGIDNLETIRLYDDYIRTNIFKKAGIDASDFLNNDASKPTLGYSYPHRAGVPGFNPGDFSAKVGGYGYYLSAIEAAKIYAAITLPENETILTKDQKEILLLNGYGNFSIITEEGKYYYHDGWWYSGIGPNANPRGFRSIWISGPEDITMVLFTNGLRNDDGLFPLRSDYYSDITSFTLWAFGQMHGDKSPKARKETINYHDYLTHPEPH